MAAGGPLVSLAERRRCASCQAPIRPSSLICVRCGTAFRPIRTVRDMRPALMAVVLVVLAVLVGVAWGLWLQA
jgi:hypothetical protein